MEINQELLDSIIEIISKNLNIEKSKLNLNSSSTNIEKWDSLSHIKIILSIEKKFGKVDNTLIHELNSIEKIHNFIFSQKFQ